MMRGRISA